MHRAILAAIAALAFCATAAQAQIVTAVPLDDIPFVTAWGNVDEGDLFGCSGQLIILREPPVTWGVNSDGYTLAIDVPEALGLLDLFQVKVSSCTKDGGPISWAPAATSPTYQFGPENDINGDGVMGTVDKNMLFSRWQCEDTDPCWDGTAIDADLDANGFVGQADLNLLKAAWQHEKCHKHWRYLYGPACAPIPPPVVLPPNGACLFGEDDPEDPDAIAGCTPPSVPVLNEPQP